MEPYHKKRALAAGHEAFLAAFQAAVLGLEGLRSPVGVRQVRQVLLAVHLFQHQEEVHAGFAQAVEVLDAADSPAASVQMGGWAKWG